MHVAVARVTEAHHLHATLLFHFVNIGNKLRGAVDRNYKIHRLLLRDGLHRFDKAPANLPYLGDQLRRIEHDKIGGTCRLRDAADTLDTRRRRRFRSHRR